MEPTLTFGFCDLKAFRPLSKFSKSKLRQNTKLRSDRSANLRLRLWMSHLRYYVEAMHVILRFGMRKDVLSSLIVFWIYSKEMLFEVIHTVEQWLDSGQTRGFISIDSCRPRAVTVISSTVLLWQQNKKYRIIKNKIEINAFTSSYNLG